jgi:hypothetical protein
LDRGFVDLDEDALDGAFVVAIFVVAFACSLASLWAFVVKFNLIFFMPEVRLSTSEFWELEVSIDGNTTLLDRNGGRIGEYCSSDCALDSFSGDFRRTCEVFEGSARGLVGALVFFTTTGGIEWPRELIEESGLTFCEVSGHADIVVPFEGSLLCPFGRDAGPSEMTDPELEAMLRRLLDWLVGCV